MHVSFIPSGDRAQASARLRVHMLGDELRARGHRVETDGGPVADLVVFQKKRNFQVLFDAKRAGARVVYDFDDHYLLEDSGARDEIFKMLNFVDVVTVGSPELLAACRSYHPNVHLFENPLDVLPRSTIKSEYEWRDQLGWFGNRAGLVALDALRLDVPVTTITAHGDIEWKLETIDGHLQRMDVVLLPVEASAWTLAKNANRMFKCVALGVPVLAAATPEHVRAVEDLGLPEWFLVPDRSDWSAALRTMRSRYREMREVMRAAAARAREAYGTPRQTDRWLEMVTTTDVPGLTIPDASRELARSLDVIVLAERTPVRVAESVASVGRLGAEVRSVSAISALPIEGDSTELAEDFFEIYPRLATRLTQQCTGDHALIVQAGVELRPAALEALARAAAPDAVVLLRPQHGIASTAPDPSTPGTETDEPPRTMAALLIEPFLPWAVMVPTALLRDGAIDPRCGALWGWDLVIALTARGARLVVVDAPVTVLAPETYAASPLDGHREHLAVVHPVAAADLPRMSTEWKRLRIVLGGYVAERHRAIFEQWAPVLAIAPRPSEERTSEERAVALHRAEKSVAKLTTKFGDKARDVLRALGNEAVRRATAEPAPVAAPPPSKVEPAAPAPAPADEGELARLADALTQIADQYAATVDELEATSTVRLARRSAAQLGIPGATPLLSVVDRMREQARRARQAADRAAKGSRGS